MNGKYKHKETPAATRVGNNETDECDPLDTWINPLLKETNVPITNHSLLSQNWNMTWNMLGV